jgi:hypothetical protein
MRKILFFIVILFIIGCGSEENNNTSQNIITQRGTPLRGGYPFYKTDKNITWIDGLDFLLKDEFNYSILDFNKTAFENLHNYIQQNKYFSMWFVKSWFDAGTPSNWYHLDSIQKAMDKGYIPVFLFYYFGDSYNYVMPNDDEISQYYKDTQKFVDYISTLKGKKIVIVEPEFNKNIVLNNQDNADKMAQVYSNAIDIIKTLSDVEISLCMMDTGNRGVYETFEKCGYKNCALGDKEEWSRSEIIYNQLLNKIDFISFQEMVSQFMRDPSNPGSNDNPNLKVYTADEIGVDFLADRINNFSNFLTNKYHKPVMLAYVSIASGVWNDINGDLKIEDDEFSPNGWDLKIDNFYNNMRNLEANLSKNNLLAYIPMALIDDPVHDINGYQAFNRNEYHLGLVSTSAKDENDTALYGDLKCKIKCQ